MIQNDRSVDIDVSGSTAISLVSLKRQFFGSEVQLRLLVGYIFAEMMGKIFKSHCIFSVHFFHNFGKNVDQTNNQK